MLFFVSCVGVDDWSARVLLVDVSGEVLGVGCWVWVWVGVGVGVAF